MLFAARSVTAQLPEIITKHHTVCRLDDGCQCSTRSGSQIAIQPDSAIQNRIQIGLDLEKIAIGTDMDIKTALITAVECLIRGFFRMKTGWDQIFGWCNRIMIELDSTM